MKKWLLAAGWGLIPLALIVFLNGSLLFQRWVLGIIAAAIWTLMGRLIIEALSEGAE